MRWERYKNKVISEVLMTPEQYSRRHHVNLVPKTRDRKVVTGLRRQKDVVNPLSSKVTSGLALDQATIGDHADFESRLMREVDETLVTSLKLNAINPGHGIRKT